MLKKFMISLVGLAIALIFIVPIAATPDDVILDRQTEILIPGKFQLIDNNQDQLAEALQFEIAINSFNQSEFLVTGNLEGFKDGVWRTIATTVVSFKWSSKNNIVTLIFYPSTIRREKIDGPYRVNIAMKEGDWSMSNLAGYSPTYTWKQFADDISQVAGEINNSLDAKRAAEIWANMNEITLGNFIGIDYNYDRWQVDFSDKRNKQVLRFLINAKGQVKIINLNK